MENVTKSGKTAEFFTVNYLKASHTATIDITKLGEGLVALDLVIP